MLQKSKRSAFVMGCIYLITAVVSLNLLRLLSAPEESLLALLFRVDMSSLPLGTRLLVWLALVGFLLTGALFVSWFVYGRDETHFGQAGVLRWAVAGFLYGMWAKSVAYPLLQSESAGADLMADVALLLGLAVSYWIAFRLPGSVAPTPEKNDSGNTELGSGEEAAYQETPGSSDGSNAA